MSSIEYDIFWNETIKQLLEEKIINDQEYTMWFNNMKYSSSEDNSIILSVPSKFYMDQIKSRYTSMLEKKLLELSGTNILLDFYINKKDYSPAPVKQTIVKQDIKIENSQKEEQVKRIVAFTPQQKPDKHQQLRKEFIFENYIIGNNNEFPANAGKAIAKNPGKEYNPCLIYGGVGLGKTHLMQAIGNQIYTDNPDIKLVYIPAETFINECIESIRSHSMKKFKSKYRNVDVLLIDDIHDFIGKKAVQEELFHTFNALYDLNKQLIFTCDRPPSELKDFEDRLKSRFERGLNLDLLPPDFETKVAILRKKLDEENSKKTNENNIEIPNDVINFIAKNITTNIRDLESALMKLRGYANLIQKEITIDVAKKQLKHVFQTNVQFNITIDKVQKVVADYFNVSTNDLKSKKRTKAVTFPRQISMYIIREITDFSTTEIGLEFGGRDHTTVIHSFQKIEELIMTDPSLEPVINNLVRTVKESGGN